MTQALKTETRDVPMLDVRAAPKPGSFDREKRTVTFIASTGARGLRRRFWGEDYYEELDISEQSIRMDRLANGAPFLNSHSSWEVGDVLGVVERAWIEHAQLMVEVRFSQRDDVDPILSDIEDGILRHVSVGYLVHEYQITEKQGELDIYRAVDWEPMEVSIVPMGFDDAAVSRSTERTSQAIINRAGGPQPAGVSIMTTEVQGSPAPEQQPENRGVTTEEATRIANEAATTAAKEATAKERQRVADIQSALRAAKMSVDDDFAQEMIRGEVDINEARERIINRWVEQDQSEPTLGIRTGVDQGIMDNLREGAMNALLVRGAVQDVQLTDHGRYFAGMNLTRLCEEILTIGGVSVRGMSHREIATRALSTSDLANIVGAVYNKTLLMGYESAPRTFVGVFRMTTNADFKAMNRVRLSGAPALEEVKEGGEFKYGKLTDEKETYSLATYGKILSFTRQTIINDDMDALIRVPMLFGRAAADLESDIVWGIIEDNAALQDGTALFHADHSNLASSGAAPSVSTIGAGRTSMRKQTGMEGRIINVLPRHLIVPANLETTVDQLMTSITPAQPSNSVPTSIRSLNPVVEPRLADTVWYMAADYNQVDTVEYCYLDGNQGVYIETREGFNIDGIEVKARHDFAAKAIDYRGLYKDPGQ